MYYNGGIKKFDVIQGCGRVYAKLEVGCMPLPCLKYFSSQSVSQPVMYAAICIQVCLAENNRDWRACQKGAEVTNTPEFQHCDIPTCTSHVKASQSSPGRFLQSQRSRLGRTASQSPNRQKKGSRSDATLPLQQRLTAKQGMSQVSIPLLYRHILRAAKQFPSIKRDSIVQEIKLEFAANKVPPSAENRSMIA